MTILISPIVQTGEGVLIPQYGTSATVLPYILGSGVAVRPGSFQTIPLITASGVALQYGSYKAVPLITGTGSGISGKVGSSSLSVPLITGTGIGAQNTYSTATLPIEVADGIATVGGTAVSAQDVPAVLVAGVALNGVITTAFQFPQLVPYPTASGTGSVSPLGSSSVVLPMEIAVGGTPTASAADVPSVTAIGTADPGGLCTSVNAAPVELAVGIAAVPYVGASNISVQFEVADGYALSGAGIVSSSTLMQFIAAADGYSGQIADSTLILPLITALGTGYVPTIGQSVSINIPLILARSTATQTVGATYSTIVMHTETQALTQYTNYPFNSYAKFNGVYLGANDSGIFALAGATDDGAFINAAARVGLTDYGTSHLKRIDRMYVGYRADGNMVMRVFTDEITSRDYLLTATGKSGLHGNHVRIGKGLAARYWQFEIQNKDGADFELNMIEVKPTVLRRRIGGGDA